MKINYLFIIFCVTLVSCAQKKTNLGLKDSEMESYWGGHVDREAVRRVIRENLYALKDCYERELKNQKDIFGKILLEFEIKDDGLIKSTKIKKTTLNNKFVEECVTNVIAKAQFSPSPKGTTAVVTYPFVFDNTKQ